jgi:hypothetical protein
MGRPLANWAGIVTKQIAEFDAILLTPLQMAKMWKAANKAALADDWHHNQEPEATANVEENVKWNTVNSLVLPEAVHALWQESGVFFVRCEDDRALILMGVEPENAPVCRRTSLHQCSSKYTHPPIPSHQPLATPPTEPTLRSAFSIVLTKYLVADEIISK